jgi:hypothetical protein
MSLLHLLSLQDEEIDQITAVVQKWSSAHRTPVDSQRGRRAMCEAVSMVLLAKQSHELLYAELSRHMDKPVIEFETNAPPLDNILSVETAGLKLILFEMKAAERDRGR